jgi:hypothetical protein
MKKRSLILLFVIIPNLLYADDLLIDVIYNGNLTALDNILEPHQLSNLSYDELRILRNMIYAKHNYIFKDNNLREYFSGFSWYNGLKNNVDNLLTNVDRENINTIRLLEYDSEEDFIFERDIEEVGHGYRILPYIVITGYKGEKKNVRIPPRIQNLPVVGISGAFKNRQLESVVIPYGITYIAHEAFMNNNLTSIYLPDSVTHIGERAFMNNKLVSARIPDGVTYIAFEAFKNNKITEVRLPNGLSWIVGRIFQNNSLTSITIPDNVRSIGNYAFADNPLTHVYLPDSVKFIGGWAFRSDHIRSVRIGANVEIWDNNEFNERFRDVYYSNPTYPSPRLAGTYTFTNGRWYRRD